MKSALSETLDIPAHIYEKLMVSISGPKSTIDGTEITYDAIAAVAAVPKFYLNRHLYIFINSMNTLSRHCPKNKYDTGGRCPKCFAKHELECIIPTHYNTRTSIPWSALEHEWGYLCGSIYCMSTFITIIKPKTITLLRYDGRHDLRMPR